MKLSQVKSQPNINPSESKRERKAFICTPTPRWWTLCLSRQHLSTFLLSFLKFIAPSIHLLIQQNGTDTHTQLVNFCTYWCELWILSLGICFHFYIIFFFNFIFCSFSHPSSIYHFFINNHIPDTTSFSYLNPWVIWC